MNKSITIIHFIGRSLYKDPTTNEWLCVGIVSWAWKDSWKPWPQIEVIYILLTFTMMMMMMWRAAEKAYGTVAKMPGQWQKCFVNEALLSQR